MAQWNKVQNQSSECQQSIHTIYESPTAFPIDVRNIFAELIEDVVCTKKLHETNPAHSESIQNFLLNLIHQMENRVNSQPPIDPFYIRNKLCQSVMDFKEKYHRGPLTLYSNIRMCLEAEQKIIHQEESVNMFLQRDEILENLGNARKNCKATGELLREVEQGHQDLYVQHIDGGNQEQQKSRLTEVLQSVESGIQSNIDELAELQTQIIKDYICKWKLEKQRSRNGFPISFHPTLEKIQLWCEQLAEMLWANFQYIREVERLQTSVLNMVDATHNTTAIHEYIIRLISELLNCSLIVENEPPQILKLGTKFPSAVSIRLLIGNKLNITMSSPIVTVNIIKESQAKLLPISDKVEICGQLMNNKGKLEISEGKVLATNFKNLLLKKIDRTNNSMRSESVMEEKCCLYFNTDVNIGELKLKVAVISLPVVVISHGSQESQALATMTWDSAFGETGRVPFQVPSSADWDSVKDVLSKKFESVTGRGLTQKNIEFLGKKLFRNRRCDKVTWIQFCKEPFTDKNFTFWDWFYANMKLVERHLKELWCDGLIMGFVERQKAESMLMQCDPGTFLLRFSDSVMGAITIAFLNEDHQVINVSPYSCVDLKHIRIVDCIRDMDKLKYLYPQTPKELAFGKYFAESPKKDEKSVQGPYTKLRTTLDVDIPNDQNNSRRGSFNSVKSFGSDSNSSYTEEHFPKVSPWNPSGTSPNPPVEFASYEMNYSNTNTSMEVDTSAVQFQLDDFSHLVQFPGTSTGMDSTVQTQEPSIDGTFGPIVPTPVRLMEQDFSTMNSEQFSQLLEM